MSNRVRALVLSLVVGSSLVMLACGDSAELPNETTSTLEQPLVDDTASADMDLACAPDAGGDAGAPTKPFSGCTTPIPADAKSCAALGNDNIPPFDQTKPTCLGTSDSLDAHLKAHPGSCNRLNLPAAGASKWTQCKNLLLMDCLKKKLLGNGTIKTTNPWPPPCDRKATYSEWLYCRENKLATTSVDP